MSIGGAGSLSPAWSEIYAYLVRPVAIYIAAMTAVRLMGKRALGQLSLFDLVIMVGIGEIVVLVGLERQVDLVDGLVMLGILGSLEILMSLLVFRWPWFARLVEGQPTVLAREGHLLERNMRREHISLRDLRQELRKEGIDDLADVQEVVLEACGKISVIPRPETEMRRVAAELAEIRRILADLAQRGAGSAEKTGSDESRDTEGNGCGSS